MMRLARLCVLITFLNLPLLAIGQIIYPGGGGATSVLAIVDRFYVRLSGTTNMTGGITNPHGFYGPHIGSAAGLSNFPPMPEYVETNDPVYLAAWTNIVITEGPTYSATIVGRTLYIVGRTNYSYIPLASVLTNASEWSRYPALQDADFNDFGMSNLVAISLSYRDVPAGTNMISTGMGTSGVPANVSEWIYDSGKTNQIGNVSYWMTPPTWTTAWLTVSNFGFSINTNRVITGMRTKVTINPIVAGASYGEYFIYACETKFVKPDGTESDSMIDYNVRTDRAGFVGEPATTNIYQPGASIVTNMWGLTLTPQEVNSNKFTAMFRLFYTNTVTASKISRLAVKSIDIDVYSGSSIPVRFESHTDGMNLSVGNTNVAKATPTNFIFYVPVVMPEIYTYPAFRLPMGGAWTDFELKASTNNFTNLVYFYISSGTNTVGRGDTNALVYFSDDYQSDVRAWRTAVYGTSIYSQLTHANAAVDTIYVYPSHDCQIPWADWMSKTNRNLVWSWVRFDGLDFEKNVDGTKQRWNLIRPDSWELERTTP